MQCFVSLMVCMSRGNFTLCGNTLQQYKYIYSILTHSSNRDQERCLLCLRVGFLSEYSFHHTLQSSKSPSPVSGEGSCGRNMAKITTADYSRFFEVGLYSQLRTDGLQSDKTPNDETLASDV